MSADRPHPDSSTAEPMSDRIAQPRMYTELAHLWTLVSAPSDYADEARHWRNVLYTKLGAGHHELLELGVGGGNNLSHILRPQVPDHGGQHTGGGCAPSKSPLERGFGGVSHQHKNTPRPSGTPLKRGKENATAEQDVIDAATISFRATAVDLSDKMLNNSRLLNPDVEHHLGDMRTVRLGRKFDAVLIHDAISYMASEDDLVATFNTAAVHLERGGLFMTTPDHFEESFVEGAVSHNSNTEDGTTLTLIEYSHRPDHSRPVYETLMFYLISEGGKVRIEQDRHRFGLFPIATWVRLLKEAGFDVEKYPYDVHDDHHESYLLVSTLR